MLDINISYEEEGTSMSYEEEDTRLEACVLDINNHVVAFLRRGLKRVGLGLERRKGRVHLLLVVLQCLFLQQQPRHLIVRCGLLLLQLRHLLLRRQNRVFQLLSLGLQGGRSLQFCLQK